MELKVGLPLAGLVLGAVIKAAMRMQKVQPPNSIPGTQGNADMYSQFGRLLSLIVWSCIAAGCVFGANWSSTSETSTIPSEPTNGMPVLLVVCDFKYEDGQKAPWGDWWEHSFRTVVTKEHGITVHKDQVPTSDESYLVVRIAPDKPTTPAWQMPSAGLSMFTFSIVPGYFYTEYPVELTYAIPRGNGAYVGGMFSYQHRIHTFIWLPTIVYPDVFATINGGGENIVPILEGEKRITRQFLADMNVALTNSSIHGRSPVPEFSLNAPCKSP